MNISMISDMTGSMICITILCPLQLTKYRDIKGYAKVSVGVSLGRTSSIQKCRCLDGLNKLFGQISHRFIIYFTFIMLLCYMKSKGEAHIVKAHFHFNRNSQNGCDLRIPNSKSLRIQYTLQTHSHEFRLFIQPIKSVSF